MAATSSAALRSLRLSKSERRLDTALDAISPARPSPPPVLYHYTSVDAALNIIRSRQFWATSHDTTGDDFELTAADEVILDVLRRLRADTGDRAAAALSYVYREYDRFRTAKWIPTALACFSEDADSAYQWREYGAAGHGLCLGVRLLDEDPPEDPEYGTSLLPVCYDSDQWTTALVEGFTRIANLLDTGPRTRKAQILGQVALLRLAGLVAVSSKTPAFRQEKEWRQVVLARRGVEPSWLTRQRERDDTTVKYLKRYLHDPTRPLTLHEIVFGPLVDRTVVEPRLRAVLPENGYGLDGFPVPTLRQSAVPLNDGPAGKEDGSRHYR